MESNVFIWAENNLCNPGSCSVLLLCARTTAWHAVTSAKTCAGEEELSEAGHTSTRIRMELSVQPFHIRKKKFTKTEPTGGYTQDFLRMLLRKVSQEDAGMVKQLRPKAHLAQVLCGGYKPRSL